MTARPVLFDYWRSSASYRVRIALYLLGIEYDAVPVNLLKKEHKSPAHMARNPRGAVPVLDIDGQRLTQSLAIVEYLHETHPGSTLLPADAPGRSRVRALADAIAMDIHPLCNLGPTGYVMELTGGGDAVRKAWMQKFIGEGMVAFEVMLDHPATGRFCHGDTPTVADLCLVPQLYNALRWEVDLTAMPKSTAIGKVCESIDAFARAYPREPV
jgi:maleylacetoacetate isomerase